MQINIKTINVLRKKDVDSQFRYSFDEALSYLIKKHYKTETDIVTLTRKLLNDFGLFDVKIILMQQLLIIVSLFLNTILKKTV